MKQNQKRNVWMEQNRYVEGVKEKIEVEKKCKNRVDEVLWIFDGSTMSLFFKNKICNFIHVTQHFAITTTKFNRILMLSVTFSLCQLFKLIRFIYDKKKSSFSL